MEDAEHQLKLMQEELDEARRDLALYERIAVGDEDAMKDVREDGPAKTLVNVYARNRYLELEYNRKSKENYTLLSQVRTLESKLASLPTAKISNEKISIGWDGTKSTAKGKKVTKMTIDELYAGAFPSRFTANLDPIDPDIVDHVDE